MSIIGAYVVPHPPIILPEVGKGEEHKIQKTIDGYLRVAAEIAEIAPETIILTSPHSILYSDYFHISPGASASGDMRQFGVSSVTVDTEYDTELVGTIETMAAETGIPAGTAGERDPKLDHATLIPLRFIEQAWHSDKPHYQVVRIGLSHLSLQTHYEFGKCIADAVEKLGRRVVFVASGDLSHRLKKDGPYGYIEEGPEFDRQITNIMQTAKFDRLFKLDPTICEKAGECGLRSIAIMAGALDGKTVEPELISYEGPFGVGYGISAYKIKA